MPTAHLPPLHLKRVTFLDAILMIYKTTAEKKRQQKQYKNILRVKRKQLANDTPVLTSQPSFHLIRISLSSFLYIYFLKPSLLRSQGQGVTRSEEKLLVKNAIIKLPIN